ncbi:MAG: OmpH family outer membrane protein [Candidatus Avigastranaerophilus sp.]
MKNSFKVLTIAAAAFMVGIATSNYAISDIPSNFKVAVVNVPKLVESSAQVKALKEQNTKNVQELAKFGETAQTAIAKEKDPKKQKALKEKYQKEFQTKRSAMTKTYENKLIEIDKNISNIIMTQAKANGYNLVLAKSAVLVGGTDITDEIAAQVK